MNRLIIALLALSFILFPITRGELAVKLVAMIENRKGEIPVPAVKHFTDIEDPAQSLAAEKLYSLGITAGTGDTTYSPDSIAEPYQVMILLGRTLYELQK